MCVYIFYWFIIVAILNLQLKIFQKTKLIYLRKYRYLNNLAVNNFDFLKNTNFFFLIKNTLKNFINIRGSHGRDRMVVGYLCNQCLSLLKL